MTTSNAKRYVSNAHQKLRDNWDEGNWAGAIIPILCFSVLLGLLIKVTYNNVEPFIYLFGEELPAASNIPIIGPAWDLLNIAYLCFGAFASWGFVNACEIIWIFIALDSKAHRSAMRAMQAEQALQEAQSEGLTDTSYTRRLKRKGLKIPFFFIEFSPVIALAGLTVDIIVNWHRYPVITSWSKFWGGLLIYKIQGVNWMNLKSIAWNLTSLEILVVLLIVCWQWIQAHRSA
jgi:hypothetical protein